MSIRFQRLSIESLRCSVHVPYNPKKGNIAQTTEPIQAVDEQWVSTGEPHELIAGAAVLIIGEEDWALAQSSVNGEDTKAAEDGRTGQ